MEKCKPWAVAAIYLMQSDKGREHYTDIVNYIHETELTEFVEKGVATSRNITEMLNQKVINNRAVFDTDGNGYYSLDNAVATLKEIDVQDVIKSLKDKGLEVNLLLHKDQEPDSEDENLGDNAMKLSEVTKKLSDEARRLSDETQKLSDETLKLTDENKKLRQETKQLKEKLQSIKELCAC